MATAQADAIPPFDRERSTHARGVLTACLVGSLVLLALCARELPAWADQKWPELSDTAKSIGDTLSAMDLSAPYDAIHAFMQRFSDNKFGG
jgi:hypothetical protein